MLADVAPEPVYGRAEPRICPPLPLRHDAARFAEFSASLGISLRPWQETSAKYLTAEGPDERYLYKEVAVIVARQNGKTTLLVPLIVDRLLQGRRIMHTAQNRELPREVFGMVADLIEDKHSLQLASRAGRTIRPRFANGQEEIRLGNGGSYRIVAPTRGGARGPSNDLVIVDELREMENHDFIGAAKPTLTASTKPQIVYLSNAGTAESEVLNAIRKRSGEDPALAYLEWSAAPSRAADDVAGWLESNPSAGHDPSVLPYLTDEYRSNRLGGTLAVFETEHLCRWVVTMRDRLVDDFAWSVAEVDELPAPRRPYMGVAMSPDGERASAAIAWRLPDESIALRLIYDVTGDPIDEDQLGKDLRDEARKLGVPMVGFDPMTDKGLASWFRKGQAQPLSGQTWANASSRFSLAVESRKLRWSDADAVTDDLTWTTRKPHDESGSFQAVRADDERPITAALAAIRAVWLASGPVIGGGARIW